MRDLTQTFSNSNARSILRTSIADFIKLGFSLVRAGIMFYLCIILSLTMFAQGARAKVECNSIEAINVKISVPVENSSRQKARKRAVRIGLRRAVARAGGAEVREQFSSQSSVAGRDVEESSSVKLTQRTKGRVQGWNVISENIDHKDKGSELTLLMNTKVCFGSAQALSDIVVIGGFENVDQPESVKLRQVVASNFPDSQRFVLKLSEPRKSYYDVKLSGVISDPVFRQVNQVDKKRMLGKFLGDTNLVQSIATRTRRVVITAAVRATYQPSGETLVETYAAERDLPASRKDNAALGPNLVHELAERAVAVSSKALFRRMELRKANR